MNYPLLMTCPERHPAPYAEAHSPFPPVVGMPWGAALVQASAYELRVVPTFWGPSRTDDPVIARNPPARH